MTRVRAWLTRTRRDLAELPPALRAFLVGLFGGGVLGALVGLVVGLIAYPPTAWAAMVEVGLPGAVLGGSLGLVGGVAASVIRRIVAAIRAGR